MIQPRPLDIVRTPGGGIAIVTQADPLGENWHARSGQVQSSIDYLYNPSGEHNAWWFSEDLEILGNLPELISKAMAHPFSSHKHTAGDCYKPQQSNDNNTV